MGSIRGRGIFWGGKAEKYHEYREAKFITSQLNLCDFFLKNE